MTVVKLAIRVAGGSGATYPFLPQLLFMQLEYKWGKLALQALAGPWLICFPSTAQCSTKQSYLILLPGVARVVENISAPPIKVLKVSKANI